MKLRSLLSSLALLLACAAPAAAATPSAPAYLDVSAVQNMEWRDGITVNFLPDEKLCRAKYGRQWRSACMAVLGEEGERSAGAVISPEVPGTWRWMNGTALRFTPSRPLSPSTAYSVSVASLAVPKSVRLSRVQAGLTTRPAGVTMTGRNVWIDPSARGAHALTAIMNFNYPVISPASDLFIVKKTAGSDGLRLGRLQQTWNEDHDSVTLTVPLASLPSGKGGVLFNVTGYRPYVVKNGAVVFTDGKNAGSASWIVPLQSSPFTVKDTTLRAVDTETLDKAWELEISLSMHVRSDVLAKAMTVAELPLNNTPGADRPYDWRKAGFIPNKLIDGASPLRLTPMQPDDFASGTLRYRLQVRPGRSIFVRIPDTVASAAGGRLSRPWLSILKADEFPTELRLLQPGSILPLRGDRKLDIQAAGLDSVRWSAVRVRRPFLALLGSMNGSFADPLESSEELNYGMLGEEAGSGTLALPSAQAGRAQFAALDLSPVLSRSGDAAPRGLLRLKLEGMKKDKATGDTLERFIVATDLGIIVKQARTGALDVFACSLSTGKPAANATVSVLGRNGLACAEARTDAEGRAPLPSLAGMPPENAPVAITAESADGDLAWMPLRDSARKADYSSFATGGLSGTPEGLNAHVFAQRGVFRPGETLHFGCILRRTDWKPLQAGMPFQAVLTDPAGRELFRRNFRSNAEGLESFDWTAGENARTGRYRLEIVIPGGRGAVLGTASALVEEFMPETMRMTASTAPSPGRGWICTGDGTAPEVHVSLSDLYGAPGADRRVTARLITDPAALSAFADWPGYTFSDPSAGAVHAERDLPEIRTDGKGGAVIPLPKGISESGSAAFRVELRGFEAGGGRSVTASASAVLSPRRVLIGCRPDGSVPRTDFIPRGRTAGMNIIAIGPDLKKTAMDGLTLAVAERRSVSSLVSDARGSFRYAETPVDREISRTACSISAEKGLDWAIPTDLPGDFVMKVSDASGEVLASFPFTVVGERLRGTAETTDAGMKLRLSKEEYAPGETIDLAVTAPYDGAGLITVERDGVCAHRWFSAKAGDSVQSITLPRDFEGRGYVTVAFARSANSPDIYLTPFACAAAPFNAGTERRDMKLRLDVPGQAAPGGRLHARLSAGAKGRAIVFAVDEGVLGLTRYTAPDPLKRLLTDRALDVETLQAFDLVMPDHGIMKSRIPGFGGGDALAAAALAGMQNPFKRRGEPPVAWWSGIVDASPDGTDISIPLPDYCSTTLRIMAVGCTPGLAGSAQASTTVRGGIVLTPQMPVAAAPGDVFEAALAASAPQQSASDVRIAMKPDAALSIEGPLEFTIPAGTSRETVRTFRVRAGALPGDAGITFTADDGHGLHAVRRGSLSIRPAGLPSTSTLAGRTRGATVVTNPRDLMPQGASASLSVSPLPLPAVRSLSAFLDGWSYGCTEQLISRAVPYALVRKQPGLLASPSRPEEEIVRTADKRIAEAVDAISERRGDDGRVGWWPGGTGSDFLTAYAADFLMLLREEGIGVPEGLLQQVCDAAESLAGTTITGPEDARTKAYAIWALSREGRVMTRELEALDSFAGDNPSLGGDLMRFFMFASKEILHMPWSYGDLDVSVLEEGSQFDALSAQALRSVLIARYNPGAVRDASEDLANAAMAALNGSGYDTFSAAQAVRAVLTLRRGDAASMASVRVRCTEGAGAEVRGAADVPAVTLEAPLCRKFLVDVPAGTGLYWSLSTRGYDRTPPAQAEGSGMEISRILTNATGAPVSTVRQGDEVTVIIKARLNGGKAGDCVIADLLPGGFEMSQGTAAGDGLIFADKREDRMLIFAKLQGESTFSYKIRAVNRGAYVVPATSCEAMYERTRHARSAQGSVEIR